MSSPQRVALWARRVVIAFLLAGAGSALPSTLASGSPAWSHRPPRPVVRLELGDDFQREVNRQPPSTHFLIASGVHRLQEVVPKDGQVFTGEPGAVMSGARVLTGFTRVGQWWEVAGQTQEGPTHPGAEEGDHQLPGYEPDGHPEDLFFDGRRLRHVAGLSALRPGTWYFDYAADKIYLADDPSGHVVETSVAARAFSGPGVRGVVIEHLTVERYANMSQTGAIDASATLNWTIHHVDASFNHAIGIHAGPGTHLHHSRMTHNGQMGLRGIGDDMVIERNEIAYNRELGYNWGWEGGALKILESSGTTFRWNWVHDNAGPGVWFDGFNRRTTIQSNLVERNTHIGIFYEISYGPTIIRWNVVRNNGAGQPGATGAGILVANSRDVQVVGNAVDSNQNGIMLTMVNRERGPDGRLETTNVSVIGNDVRMPTGVTGLVDETGNDAYYTSKGIVFDRNTYRLDDPDAARFVWLGRWWPPIGWESWRATGNDASGALVDGGSPQPGVTLDLDLKGIGPWG